MEKTKKIRIFCGVTAALLLLTEILIGKYARGFVRNSLGDVLVVILLWAIWRTAAPQKPKNGILLPLCILAFAFCVELLQLWGFCDRLHITNRLLRIIIGTGFSFSDLVCYAAGILPCIGLELWLRHSARIS